MCAVLLAQTDQIVIWLVLLSAVGISLLFQSCIASCDHTETQKVNGQGQKINYKNVSHILFSFEKEDSVNKINMVSQLIKAQWPS